MRARAGRGRWRSIPRSCGRISMPLAPGTPRPRTSTPNAWHRHHWPRPRAADAQGADRNDKNPDATPTTGAVTGRARDRETLGRSRGGLSTKIHLAADSRARPLARVTSAGQRNDALGFAPVMNRVRVARRGRGRPRTRPGRVLADKAYSSRGIRSQLRRRGIQAVIPEPADQARHRKQRGSAGGRPVTYDPDAYRLRNTVERAVNKLRGHRAVATRFDKRDYIYRGTVDVASIGIWLRDPVN
jgi:Transposase DDE domain